MADAADADATRQTGRFHSAHAVCHRKAERGNGCRTAHTTFFQKECNMHKKAMQNLTESLVKRVQARANEDTTQDEPAIEEADARTLLGIYLRKNGAAIVAEICPQTLEVDEPAEGASDDS